MTYSNYSDKKEIHPVVISTVPIVPSPPSPLPTATLGQETAADLKHKKKHPLQYYVKCSFMITYILLLTTATITFIEAMRTDVKEVRHVMNLETCISIIAGYFYSLFISQIENYGKEDKPVDWSDITKTRYIDWVCTTPLMLFTLCIVLGIHTKVKVPLLVILSVIALNYVMLYIGYLGEINVLSRWTSSCLGFVPFHIMFYIIYVVFVSPKYVFANQVLFWIYFIVWSLYGMVYMLNEELKNITTNILDLIAKCFIGIGLWVYYSNMIV